MFGEEMYLRWKSMNFHERMIEKIENLCEDKVGLMRSMKKFHREEVAKVKAAEEAYLRSLSPIRRKTLMAMVQESGTTGRKSQLAALAALSGGAAGASSPSLLASPSPQESVGTPALTQDAPGLGASPLRLSPQRTSPWPRLPAAGSPTPLQASPSLKLTGIDVVTPAKGDGNEQQGDPLAITNKYSSCGSSALKLRPQDTSAIKENIAGYDLVQDDIAGRAHENTMKVQRYKEGLAASLEEEDDEHPVPPASLVRENTCLVLEDDTLVIRIPVIMDRLYAQHLKKLEQEARDL